MSRPLVLALILASAACDGDGSSLPVDATAAADAPRIDGRIVDAPMIDAPMIDAPMIDAPPGSIAQACMHACDAIGVCAMDTDPGCVGECSADLADCTPQEVGQVDACTTMACGDANGSPLIECIAAVPCVEM
jgi:hypothetical protein